MRSARSLLAGTAVCLLSVVGLLATVPAFAVDGAIPIWEPTVITQPGKYVVIQNIDGPPSTPVLTIAASNVQVDLNGFTLRNDGDAPVVLAEDLNGIAIENGNVVQGGSAAALQLENVRQFTVRRIMATKTGFNETGILLTNCEFGMVEKNLVEGPFELSLAASGSGIHIRQNILTNTDCEAGVSLGASDSTFEHNILGLCSRLHVFGSGNRITSNEVRGVTFGSAISVWGSRNRVDGNTLIDNDGWGLWFEVGSSNNLYSGNLARGNNGSDCSGTSSAGDFCDEGTNNTSAGDNYIPNQM